MDGVVVYGDVLFAINFLMDFLVLFCTSKIMHIKQRSWRLIAASALGGTYGVAALFIENTVLSVVCNIAAALVMCLISFPRLGRLTFFKCTVLFYGLSLLLGGAITASYILLSKLGRSADAAGGIAPALSDISLGTFLLLGAVSMILAFITGKLCVRQSAKKEAAVEIEGAGGTVRLRCLSDSGALLCEPVSGSPVIIVDLPAVRPCLSPELFEALSDGGLGTTAEGMRLIPGGGIGGSTLLPGFLPRRVRVCGVERVAVIAVVNGTDLGGFDGIVPASLCK